MEDTCDRVVSEVLAVKAKAVAAVDWLFERSYLTVLAETAKR